VALGFDPPTNRSRGYVVYSVLDAMLASTFSALGEVGLRLDALAGAWTGEGDGGLPRGELRPTVATIATMRHRATGEQAVLPSNLKAPEIAGELFVSPNTVRTHLRHIYAKLDVHNRSEAVARARELGLLAPGADGSPITQSA
jgi:Bacterial regulatory proteins, luxR family